ncbi:pentatricopeptide repeat-containing protein 2, mitochondrial-like [Cimex lectularius]|uniref:Pentatricopeptide repeat-containing protein 2, mitochondrial n=1 Tax=Cimex lectularius TaxID=79782 RepID=A0A8I6RSB7_CIMLE|nr:pentatricopeptide repeat-containing protein 2, mitochondrial-like [Cimex lectularius]
MISLRNSLISHAAFFERHFLEKCTIRARRTLYSAGSIGLDAYQDTREKIKSQFGGIEDKFKTKMTEYTNTDANSTIFTEDLKNMVHLVENEEVSLVEQMIKKFAKQNREMRFGSFVFGPVIMRMYYHLNMPVAALEMFKDPELEGFFDQLVTFQILMDLLLVNDMDKEVIEVFDMIKFKQLQGSKYPKNAVVLVLAACYKLNTTESFEYMKTLYNDLNKCGHIPMRRAGTFAAALAIEQNAPHIALEILTSMKKQSYVTIRNLKMSALAALGRPEDTLSILRAVLEFDGTSSIKHTFDKETVRKVAEAIEMLNNPVLKEEFDRIIKQLHYLGHISEEPLSKQLWAEISGSPKPWKLQQEIPKFGRQPNYSNYPNKQTQRPGLKDMA